MHKKLAVFIIAMMLTVSLLPVYTSAQETATMIRVALAFDSGGTLNTSVPVATIYSANGLRIYPKNNIGEYVVHPSHTPIRLSLDHYRVLVDESTDLSYANTLLMRLEEQGYKGYILAYTRKNVQHYQVVYGDEASYTSAQSLMNQLKQKVGVAKEVLGPYTLSAGSFLTEAEAFAQIQNIVDAGFDASIGYAIDAMGITNYYALVGNEASEAELTALLQEVSLTFPDVSFTPVIDAAYVRQVTGMYNSGNGYQWISHYFIPPQLNVSVAALSGSELPVITFVEKSGRSYRGSFDVLRHNGHLAIVNELPLEQYLYSVVGTEMASGWPLEALKAQAVIARTYALGKGNRYGIAHLSDTTYDQAYYGVQREAADVRRAVDETAGIVLKYNGKLAEAYYYSNAGGQTAIGAEVWGNDVPYLRSVSSPDEVASASSLPWYLAMRDNGQLGYIRSDLVASTWQKTPVGFEIATVLHDNTNFRSAPGTWLPSLDKLMQGERLILIESVPESTAYEWMTEPIDGVQMMNLLNTRATAKGNVPHTKPITSLTVDTTGPSGRVMSMSANGIPIVVSYPDAYRTVFGGLRSTYFEVEEMAKFTVLGAGGKTVQYPQSNSITVVTASGTKTYTDNEQVELLLYNQAKQVRVVTNYPAFRFHGKGYGHGLGLSQWGAKGMADQGYDYVQILKHYYTDQITLEKIG